MDSELTTSERNQLIDFARAMVERARQAGSVPAELEQDSRYISLRDDLDPKTVLELLSQYRRFFEKTRSQLTREVDAVLLIVERLEKELAVLRGEIQGLRNERQEFLTRFRRAEQDLGAAAEEFTRQISAQVAGLANRFNSYVDEIGHSAPPTAAAQAKLGANHGEIGDGQATLSSPPAVLMAEARDVEAHRVLPRPVPAAPATVNNHHAEPAKGGRTVLMGLVRGRKARRSAPADENRIALADRARDARDWAAAVRHYREALDIIPDAAPIWVQYGHALKENGKRAQAEDAYRKSIELDPNNADTHLQLGHVLKMQGKLAGAASAYIRALALDAVLQDARKELLGLGWTEARIQNALL